MRSFVYFNGRTHLFFFRFFINATFYVICRSRNNEPGIEMKVMHSGEGEDMAASLDKAINEISAENSMVSIDNVNSIIGQ